VPVVGGKIVKDDWHEVVVVDVVAACSTHPRFQSQIAVAACRKEATSGHVTVMTRFRVLGREIRFAVSTGRRSLELYLLDMCQWTHGYVARQNVADGARFREHVVEKFPHDILPRVGEGSKAKFFVCRYAIDAEAGRNVRADDDRLHRFEKTFEVCYEVKIEWKLEMVRVEAQLRLLTGWVYGLLWRMQHTLLFMVVEDALRSERLQARQANVMCVFVGEFLRDQTG